MRRIVGALFPFCFLLFSSFPSHVKSDLSIHKGLISLKMLSNYKNKEIFSIGELVGGKKNLKF